MKRLAFFALLLFVCAPLFAADSHFTVDFAHAKQTAAKEGKDVLIEFVGSDWCPPCKAMIRTVMSDEAFISAITRDFVLMRADYPRDTSNQTEAEMDQNRELGKLYDIPGYPSIVLTDASGAPYAKHVGYEGESPRDFLAMLTSQQEFREKRDALIKKADAAEGVEKAKLLDEALMSIGKAFSASGYKEAVDAIVQLDADNQAGLKEKYTNILRVEDTQKKVWAIRRAKVPLTTEEKMQRLGALLDECKSGQEKVRVYYALAREAPTGAETVKYAKLGIEAAPESEQAGILRELIAE
ncbi:MAG: thioredoxin fold domain-containing protein [bacterium]|nr:thioredoxin fold domain-containing protein [bacterium]